MGQSTDGILVFGVNLVEEESSPDFLEDYDGDFDEFILDKAGISDWGDKRHPYEERKKTIDAFPLDLTRHCSIEYSMYILSIRGTEKNAGRGDPMKIDPEQLTVDPEKIKFLLDFCEENEIEYTGEPSWYLCSMWG